MLLTSAVYVNMPLWDKTGNVGGNCYLKQHDVYY